MVHEDIKDKGLQDLFAALDGESLPIGLNKKIVCSILKVQKTRRRWSIVGLILFCLSLVGIAVFIISYFTSFQLTGLFKNTIESVGKINCTDLPFYILIGGIAGVLLMFDYQLRKIVARNQEK